ncbi:MAG: 2-hydroxychromene-2-carboxylate isomerase [Pseudomonas marincola]
MTITIDYYAGIASPWTYLGHERICNLAKKYQAELIFKPVDFGIVFDATGGLPLPKRSIQRQNYRLQEMKRWRDELSLPLTLKPEFLPIPNTEAALMVIAAGNMGDDNLKLAGAFLTAVWANEVDITTPEKLAETASAAGFDGQRLLKECSSSELKSQYKSYATEAIDRGVFGAPSYVIGDDIFWGQDRLHFVEKKLKESSNNDT